MMPGDLVGGVLRSGSLLSIRVTRYRAKLTAQPAA